MVNLEYLRKSRDRREKDDPDVLLRHRAILADLARADKAEIHHSFEEVRSGERIKSRPEFCRLLDLIRGLPDCPRDRCQGTLYCMDADRLSRGMLREQGEIQELLITKGVVLRTPSGTSDLRDRVQRLTHTIQGAVAEHELAQFKERVARSRSLQVIQAQVRTGSVPFGYDWDHATKSPKPHPEEFVALQQICEEAFTCSIAGIAEKHGLPDQRVWRALRSPMICGWPAKTTRWDAVTRRVHYLPREEWVWPEVEGNYPKAMGREEWERLQLVIDGRQKGTPGAKQHNHWCRDVVEFVEMPGRVTLAGYHSPHMQYPIYVRQSVRGGKKQYVSRQEVHEAVERAIEPVIYSKRFFKVLTSLGKRRDAGPDPAEVTLEAERKRIETMLKNLRRDEINPETDPAEIPGIRELRKDLLEELKRLAPQSQKIRSRAPTLSKVETSALAQWVRVMQELPFCKAWSGIGDAEKRIVVNGLVESVEVEVLPPTRGPWLERRITVRLQPWARDL